MQNPYNITFGIEPSQYINRLSQYSEIVGEFNRDEPSSQIYLITGVRGSGKTVLLSTISNHFKENKDWIVVELNPERNMIESLAAKIYDRSINKFKFHVNEFSFSFKGFSISLSGEKQIVDVESLLETMLTYIKNKNKKVLVAVDEVSNDKEMKEFAHTFQILLRQKLPIYCLMTGLFENVKNLEDEKNLTFLYRAPKINLGPLNTIEIARKYKDTFNLNEEESVNLSKLTKGYAFAYQVLGYLLYRQENKTIDEEFLNNYDLYLKEHSYDKIWASCPKKEKDFLVALTKTNKMIEIINKISVSRGAYSSLRDRLIKKGILLSKEWGSLEFALPRFDVFIKNELTFNI